MRSKQWFILGTLFILLDMWFIYRDKFWISLCDVSDLSSQLIRADIVSCLNGELLEPFIWILFPLGIAFYICGWIEEKEEKKRKKK